MAAGADRTACESWNQLPGISTKNRGSAQNPPDLAPYTYNSIRYTELPSENNPVRWLFISRRCMHCDAVGA